MAVKKRSQTSGIFLLELTLAILFFAMVSSVCVRFFVKSHIYSRDALRLSQSVSEISSVLEITASAEAPKDAASRIQECYPSCSVYKTTGSQVVIWYDSSFTPCSEVDAVYAMHTDIALSKTGMLSVTCTMYTYDLSETIYSLESLHHIQEASNYE